MALVAGDLLFVPRGYRGILLGTVAAVKLTPFIFFINLVAARDFKSAGRALASFAGCGLIMWVFWPSESHEFWLHDPNQPGRPISWSHPWVWVLLIPPMVLAGQEPGQEPGPGVAIERLLHGIVIVTCVAPYWLFQSDGFGAVPQAMLPVYTAAVLVIWAATELAALREGQFEPATALVPSAGRLSGLAVTRPTAARRSHWPFCAICATRAGCPRIGRGQRRD